MADGLIKDQPGGFQKEIADIIDKASKQFSKSLSSENSNSAILYEELNQAATRLLAAYQRFNTSNFGKQSEGIKQIVKKWHSIKYNRSQQQGDLLEQEYSNYLSQRNEAMKNINSEKFEEAYKILYKECLLYQEAVNRFLNKQIITIFAFQGKNGTEFYYTTEPSQLLNFAKIDISSTGNIVLRLPGRAAEDSAIHKNKLSNSLSNKDQDKNLKETHKTVVWRYNYSKRKRTKNGAIILWKDIIGGWAMAFVSSFGSIQEAYTYFLAIDHFQKTKGYADNDNEGYIDYFMNQGVLKVTNMPGLYKGDITLKKELNNENSIQISVKSMEASLMAVSQYVSSAKKVQQHFGLKRKDSITPERLKNKLTKIITNQEKKQKGINKVITKLEEEIMKECEEMITDEDNYLKSKN